MQIWVLCNTMSEGQDRKVVSEDAVVVIGLEAMWKEEELTRSES